MIQPPPLKTPGWFERNWKWLVPLLVVSVLTVFALLAGAILFGVFHLMKDSDVYKMALAEVQTNNQSKELLGIPIHARWWLSGTINVSGPNGYAALSIPVAGSKQEGTLNLEANKRAGRWQFEYLILQTKDGKIRMSLLQTNSFNEMHL